MKNIRLFAASVAVTVVLTAALLSSSICAAKDGSGGSKRGGEAKGGGGGVSVGSEAPDFTLKDLDGNSVTLSSFRGSKPVFLVFGSYT